MSGNGEYGGGVRGRLAASPFEMPPCSASMHWPSRISPICSRWTMPRSPGVARRVIADKSPGFPCRVSLLDAEPGESLILVHHLHHDVTSPYRASGPVYVREAAVQAQPDVDEIPLQLRRRLLALRGFDHAGMTLRGADVVEGAQLEDALAKMFADAAIDYIHIHNCRAGCYAAKATRA